MSPLDEQEQINELRGKTEKIHDEIHAITTLLLGDKLKDPDARSLIDDIKENRIFRETISKRLNWVMLTGGGAILGLIAHELWGSFISMLIGG